MKRNLKIHVDGIQCPGAIPLPYAKKKLEKLDDSSTLLYLAWNGHALFVKDKGEVRLATDEEFQKYKQEMIRKENARTNRKR